jgi:hypothetical protein
LVGVAVGVTVGVGAEVGVAVGGGTPVVSTSWGGFMPSRLE